MFGLRGPLRAAAAGALAGFGWAALIAHLALAPQLAKATKAATSRRRHGRQPAVPFRAGRALQVRGRAGADEAAPVPPRVALSWYRGFRERGAAGRRTSARRALAPHGPPAAAARQRQSARLRLRSLAAGAGRARNRLRARRPARQPAPRRLRAQRSATWSSAAAPRCARASRRAAGQAVRRRDRGAGDRRPARHRPVGLGRLQPHRHQPPGVDLRPAHHDGGRAGGAWRCRPCGAAPSSRAPRCRCSCRRKRWPRWPARVTALLYVLLAGFGVPAQRTFYMLAVVAAALWTGRVASVSHVLCLALGVVVLLDPWAVLWPGFWLSFGAVARDPVRDLGRVRRRHGWRGALRLAAHTQYAVTLGLVPLTLLLFSQVSLVSPLANAVAIPVVSLVVTPLALAGALLPAPLAARCCGLAHLAVELLARRSAWLAASAARRLERAGAAAWVFALALAGTAWMLAPRGWPHRWAGAAAWVPMLAAAAGAARRRQLHGHRLRRRAGHGAAGGNAPATGCCTTPARSTRRVGCAAAASSCLTCARAASAARRAGGVAQRHRSCRRRADPAGSVRVGGCAVSLGAGAPVVQARASAHALRGGPALGLGWRALRDAAADAGQL